MIKTQLKQKATQLKTYLEDLFYIPNATIRAPVGTNVRMALSYQKVRETVVDDFSYTFHQIGMGESESLKLAREVVAKMTNYNDTNFDKNRTIEIMYTGFGPIAGYPTSNEYKSGIKSFEHEICTENEIAELFEKTYVNGVPFTHLYNAKLGERPTKVVEQLSPFLKNTKGKVLDWGAGSGLIAQRLHDKLELTIEAVDVRDFREPNVSIKYLNFNGYNVPIENNNYEAAILTNVLHHSQNSRAIIKELARIVSDKVLIIETIPENDSIEEWCRTFINDVLWNRCFNRAQIPVPGAYDSADGWIKSFARYGWRCRHSKDLGYDQPTIRDRHHLLVFEKQKQFTSSPLPQS